MRLKRCASIICHLKCKDASSFTIEMVHFSVNVQLFTGDFPARSKCNQQVNHNGFFACSRCLLRGSRCLPPCKRHTLYRWEDFVRHHPQQRTQSHINECSRQLNAANTNVFGIIGSSPLSAIISIPDQSTFDYFHLVLEVHFRYEFAQNPSDPLTSLNLSTLWNESNF